MALLPASSHPLYPRFLDLLLSTILPLVTPPIEELHYLSQSLWPLYTSALHPHHEMTHLGLPYPDPVKPPPKLVIDVKLFTTLQHHIALPLASAVESLLPRQIGHLEFKSALRPHPGKERALPRLPERPLPLAARILLIAAYCASYNPSKTDSRLFGRANLAGGKRKKGGGTRRAGYGKVRMGKVISFHQEDRQVLMALRFRKDSLVLNLFLLIASFLFSLRFTQNTRLALLNLSTSRGLPMTTNRYP